MTLFRVSYNFALLSLLICLVYGLPQDINTPNLRAGQPRRLLFPANEDRTNNANSILSYSAQQQTVQQGVGGTGIPCNSPGQFVPAPDGCNQCLCEQNGELGTACTKAYCPPGLPSGNNRRPVRL